jgi:hypothetical protein
MIVALTVLHVVILSSGAYLLLKNENSQLRFFLWTGWVLKLSAGILLGLLYQYYYPGGDTFIFFRDAKQLSHVFRTDPVAYLQFLWNGNESHRVWASLSEIQPRSLFFTKIISMINIVTLDNYWITGLYLSFASFLASRYLIKRILVLFPDAVLSAVLAFLFFPTVLFWSSGMIKESLAITCLFFLAGLFLVAISKKKLNVWEWILLPAGLWMLWMLKYYWAAVFFPAAISTLVFYIVILPKIRHTKFIVHGVVWLVLFFMICSGAVLMHPNFNPEYFLHVVVDNHDVLTLRSDPQNLIQFNDLRPTWLSILINSPWALFSGLVRPFLFEGGGLLKFLYALENALVLVLMLSSAGNIRRVRGSRFGMVAVAVIAYAIILCVFLALSTPNFGTLARYRIGFLPFLIFLMAYRNPLLEKYTLTKQD